MPQGKSTQNNVLISVPFVCFDTRSASKENPHFGVGLDSEKRIFNEKMRKEHKKREKMGKETIGYRKSANDIKVVNYSVHSNNQNEYMQAYRAPVLSFKIA